MGKRPGAVRPPATAEAVLSRPRLEEWLDRARDRRLTVLVADAGFGKTTLLRRWAEGRPCAWYTLGPGDADAASLCVGLLEAILPHTPGVSGELRRVLHAHRGPAPAEDEPRRAQAWAAWLSEALEDNVPEGGLSLVLDDVHEVGDDTGAVALLEAIVRLAPEPVRLVTASRAELPFPIQRMRGRGQVAELTGAELSFTIEETRAILGEDADEDIAAALHRETGGWPAAVRLAAEALRPIPPAGRAAALDSLRRRGGPLLSYLATEVIEREPPAVRSLLRAVALLERFDADLCATLGVSGAASLLEGLARRGLFVEPRRDQPGWFALNGLVRRFVTEQDPLGEPDAGEIARRAAERLWARGFPADAATVLLSSGDREGLARLLDEAGEQMLAAGAVDVVARATAAVPAAMRTPEIDRIEGDARQVRGDWDGALAWFERAGAGREVLDARLAWRIGLIHYLRGRLADAIAAYERGRLTGAADRDESLLCSWWATAHRIRGDADECRRLAGEALRSATECGDAQALAAAHTVLAMHARFGGDRAAGEEHDARALEQAVRAGDILQQIRIRANRGGHLIEDGAYEEGIAECDEALRLADLTGFVTFRALALSNRGEAKWRLGMLDEATADLEAARGAYERLGSNAVSYPLGHLGDVHRDRGDTLGARMCYEQAAAVAERAGDAQGLVPALAGLARLLAPADPELASQYAARALEQPKGSGSVVARIAASVAALARGDRLAAAAEADAAAEDARLRGDRPMLAEAMLAAAAASTSPEVAAERLEDAAALARALGAPILEARAELAMAARAGGTAARALAERAERSLRRIGARGDAASARDLLARLDREAAPALSVQALGAYRVLRGGTPVALSEWRSKKARDLLKILIARRGRPAPREELIEMLWPEEDPSKTGNRLSVALATLRGVLDPEGMYASDHFVAGDRASISVVRAHVSIDVEEFLEEAERGLRLRRAGNPGEALPPLLAAEGRYEGDFCEDDPYEQWAVPLREEARAAYVSVLHALAEEAAGTADHDAAIRYMLRVLERDAYDERAHLALVDALAVAGRHGEARRAYATYSSRMAELGAEAAPFPAPASLRTFERNS